MSKSERKVKVEGFKFPIIHPEIPEISIIEIPDPHHYKLELKSSLWFSQSIPLHISGGCLWLSR
jgi:hypothetical protein